jgi:hypothetical protein
MGQFIAIRIAGHRGGGPCGATEGLRRFHAHRKPQYRNYARESCPLSSWVTGQRKLDYARLAYGLLSAILNTEQADSQ